MNGLILTLGSVNADFQVRVDQPPGEREMAMAHDLCRLGGARWPMPARNSRSRSMATR